MNANRSFRALYVVTGFAGLAALLVSGTARADRVYVVEESPREPEVYEARSSLDLAFDGEGAVPLMDRRFQSGNDLTGGGGFKIRVGDQIRFPGLRFTPEVGYGFDHLFATDNADLLVRLGHAPRLCGRPHRLRALRGPHVLCARRLRVARHRGSHRRRGERRRVRYGFALDFHVVRHVGFGGHVEYAAIDAQPYTPQWLALGLHADIAF